MMASLQPARYLLAGFGAVFRARAVEFDGSLPASVPVCSLCLCVPSDHYTLSCKHVYCSACFSDVVQTRTSYLRCPVDGRNLRPRKPVPKGRTQPEDLGFLVAYCWNKENGCRYSGPLDDMTRHFDGECAFYKTFCSLCSEAVLRCDLAAHVEAAHLLSGGHAGGRGHPAAGDSVASVAHFRAGRRPANQRSSTPSYVDGTAGSPYEVSLEDTAGSGDAQESDRRRVLKPPCSREELQVLMEDVASRTAENIKRHSERLFLELLSGIEITKDHLQQFAEAAKIALPVDRVPAAALPSSSVLSQLHKEELVLKQFDWVLGSYSRLRAGVHYVDSPAFLVVPGHTIQLKACIDGIKTVELSASVRVQSASDAPSANGLLWPFQRVCAFKLLHNSDEEGHVRRSFAPCDAFKGRDVTSAEGDGVLVSRWLCIAKMDRNVFERDYVKDDAFTILFSMK